MSKWNTATMHASLRQACVAGETYKYPVYAVMKELTKKDLLYLDLPTVTGKTVGENIAYAYNKNPEVIRPVENPYSETGGIAVLKGNGR